MRHLFSIPLGQEIAPKSIPKNSISLGAAAIIAGGTALASGINSWASSQANKANASMDRATREWQSEENAKNRQWQENMWNAQNLYNTPSAQRDRLREAGYNPWISGSGGMANVAQGAGTPASASTPQHTQQQALPLGQFASGLTDAASLYLQSKSVDANVANQQAQTDKMNAETYAYLYKNLGEDAANNFAAAHNMSADDNSFLKKSLEYDLQKNEFDAKQQQLSYEINTRLSEREREAALAKTNQEYVNLVGELGKMSSESDLNRQKIKESVANCIRSVADAYKLRKEGDKYVADARTINAIRDDLLTNIRFRNDILSNPANDAKALNDAKSGFRNWLISDEGRKEVTHKYQLGQKGSVDALQIVSGVWNDVMPSIFTGASVNGNGQKYEYGNSSSDVFSTFTK